MLSHGDPMFALDDLENFVQVARLGSMRRAADHFGIAPSAVSRHLSRLEHVFGATLLERRANGVALTSEGEMFLRTANEILQKVADLEADLSQLQHRPGGQVRIHTIEGMTKGFLAPLIGQLREKHPPIAIKVQIAGRELVLSAIEDYESEIGLVYDHFSNPGVETVANWKQPLLAFARRGHPVLSGKITPDNLARYGLAVPDKTFGIRRLVDQAFRQRGLQPFFALVANQLQVLIQSSIESDLITFMPLQAARQEVARKELVPIDTAFPELQHRFVSVVVRSGRPLSRHTKICLDEICRSIAPAEEEDRLLLAELPAHPLSQS